jgi:hypothetical protein
MRRYILKLRIAAFRRLARAPLAATADTPVFSLHNLPGARNLHDLGGRLWEGATVTYMALQTAFYLGFETSFLIACITATPRLLPNTTIVSQGDDPNHLPGYIGKSFAAAPYLIHRDALTNCPQHSRRRAAVLYAHLGKLTYSLQS